jgi:hypothetical protein
MLPPGVIGEVLGVVFAFGATMSGHAAAITGPDIDSKASKRKADAYGARKNERQRARTRRIEMRFGICFSPASYSDPAHLARYRLQTMYAFGETLSLRNDSFSSSHT